MNVDVARDARPDRQAAADVGPLRRLGWSVRREIWENRSIYLAPLAVAALVVVASGLGLARLPETLRVAAELDAVHRSALVEKPYTFAAMVLMLAATIVGFFYCLDALYGERRDRSILFWKSLPVSDTTTVLAKATIPLVVLPLVTFVATVAAQAVMVVLASGRLAGTDLSVWSDLSFGRMTTILLYHLVLGHGFWYAPFWGWLLMVSAWSRRAPLLWATLPPLAVGLVEKLAFGTSYFVDLLRHRFMGGPVPMASGDESLTLASVTPGSPVDFLVSPGFWLGLALTAAFLAAAIRLRRYRDPV